MNHHRNLENGDLDAFTHVSMRDWEFEVCESPESQIRACGDRLPVGLESGFLELCTIPDSNLFPYSPTTKWRWLFGSWEGAARLQVVGDELAKVEEHGREVAMIKIIYSYRLIESHITAVAVP